MIELQFDAGGRRCVAALPTNGTPVSCDAGLEVGVEYKAPIEVTQSNLRSLLFHATRTLTVQVGEQEFQIEPHSPLMWFKEWPTDCPLAESATSLPITATATEENTQLTILLVT